MSQANGLILRGTCIHAHSRTSDLLTLRVKELGSSACCRKFNVAIRDGVESVSNVSGLEIGINLEGKAKTVGPEHAYADAAT